MFFSIENTLQEPCSTGLDPKVGAALGGVFGLVFILLENKNRLVRYCAVQSTLIWAAWLSAFIVLGVLSWIPLIGIVFYFLNGLITLAALAASGFLAFHGYHFRKVIVPQLSKICDEWSRVDP